MEYSSIKLKNSRIKSIIIDNCEFEGNVGHSSTCILEDDVMYYSAMA
jgi:hypothetical protein